MNPQIFNNQEIIVQDQDQRNGNVHISLSIEPHPFFKRINEFDLEYIHTLPLRQALCGTTFKIKYLDGKDIEIETRGKIISPSSNIIFEGKGLQEGKGKLIVKFNIIFPSTISAQDINILSNLSSI